MSKLNKKQLALSVALISHVGAIPTQVMTTCNKPDNHFRGGITKCGKTKFPRSK